jgi:S-adenosyl-L-methionine hydrolase (adenosine-forming)
MAGTTRTRNRAPRLITLLTDFGSGDYFVGAMKGVILSLNPEARIVDLTHEIPGQDIQAAAFNLLAVYRSFAAGTIHVAVVDPGVGSSRRPIAVSARDQFFVGPDNGIFSYILEREPAARILHLTNEMFFHHPVSNTFHGRDIFAPIAAALSTGISVTELGSEITDPVRLASLAPERMDDGSLRGRIIHIDRFGNCITNFTPEHITESMIASGLALRIKGKVIRDFREFFATAGDKKLFAIWGSAGFLEIAARNQSAANLLKARVGYGITIRAGV